MRKITRTIILVFFLMTIGSLFATVITVGTGTSYSSQYEPICPYWGYVRSAAIYKSSEIGGSGTIQTIAFKAYNTKTVTVPVKVYIKTTTATTVTSDTWATMTTGATQVYNGSVVNTTAGAWKVIDITDYTYSGSNLMVLVESNYGGSGTSTYPYWYYTSTTNAAAYIHQDSSAPTGSLTVSSNRSNIQLDISGYTVFPPVFGVDPTSIAWGDVVQNTTTAGTNVTVTNAGAGTLNITGATLGGTDPARFAINWNGNSDPGVTPWALAAGASKTIILTFNPIAVASYSAYLRFVGDVKVNHDVALSGNGIDPTIISFPYTQSFDAATFAPAGWLNYKSAGTGTLLWARVTSGSNPTVSAPHSGAGMAMIQDFSNAAGTINALVTPAVVLPGSNYQVSFWMYRDASSTTIYPNEGIKVYLGSTSADTSSATQIGYVHRRTNGSPAEAAAGWYKYTFNFPGGSAGTKYVIFNAFSDYGYNMYIDDIGIQQQPAAVLPAILDSPLNNATGVLASATLNWHADGGGPDPTGYRLYFDTNPDPTTWVNEANPTATAYDPTPDMAWNQKYYWKVIPYSGSGDASGCLIWNFTTLAPPAAAGTPNPTDSASGVTRNASLSWGAVSGATSYDVYFGTSLPGTANANVTSATWTPPTMAASTPYVWKVVPKNAAGEATGCATWSFTTGTGFQYAASAATSTDDDDIGNVTFSNINNGAASPLTGNTTSVNLYTDYTSVVGNVQQTNTYPVSITQINQASFYSCWVKVFIDLNQNGTFDLPAEQLFSATTSSTVNPVTGNITIPGTASLGSTRMRVVLRESGTELTTLPTGTYTWGETEDYTVVIALPSNEPGTPSTPLPLNNALGIARNAGISWVNGARTDNVEVRFGTASTPTNVVYTGTAITSLTNAQLGGPFTYGQTYYWQVIASNSFAKLVTAGPIWNFTIMADPTIYPPYLQTFETCTVPAIPSGWSIINVNADTHYWQTISYGGNNAAKCMQITYNDVLAMDDWFWMGPVNVTEGQTLGVRFYYKAASATWPERLEVCINEDPTPGSAIQIWDNNNIINTTYLEGVAEEEIAGSGQLYVGFHGYSVLNMYNLYVDDISIITSGNGVAEVYGEAPTTLFVQPIILGGYSLIPGVVIDPPVGNAIDSFFDVYLELNVPEPGITNPGLIYRCNVSNPLILSGLTLTLSYAGLDYTPGVLYYKTGVSWITPTGVIWDTILKTATFTISSKGGRSDELIVVFGGPETPLPVELTSFTATLSAEYFVNLAWTSQSETSHLGYNLLRNNASVIEDAIKINTDIISDGVHSGTMTDYSYTDDEVEDDVTYYYWLESVDLSGSSMFFGPLTVLVSNPGNPDTPPVIPVVTKLCNAYPNPFNPQTIIAYDLKTASDVSIQIYNVKGQLIKILVNAHRNAGHYDVVWNGSDENGNTVGSGVYFYRMDAGKYHKTQKMVMMK
jgi:hypothetical protein